MRWSVVLLMLISINVFAQSEIEKRIAERTDLDKPINEEEVCGVFLLLEEEMNKDLPKKVDEITELIQVKVNCENKNITYTRRILVVDSQMADGWKARKQRQWVQLMCNKDGIASQAKWTARDVMVDVNYDYLVTLTASPEDCK